MYIEKPANIHKQQVDGICSLSDFIKAHIL